MNPQCTDNRTAKLTINLTGIRLSANWEEQNIIKYTIWNVMAIVNKKEELDSVLNEKQIKIIEN